jgi:thiamine biosynthesis lipoprotein
VFVGCSRRARVHHDSFLAMDAVVSLSLVVPSDAAGQVGVAAVRREMERLESILSDYRPNSNVSRINRRETEDLAPETRLLLERAQHVCRETDGAFDVTVRPIKRLWGFGTGGMPHVPAPDSIRALLPHIRCDAYEITADGRFVWRDSLAEIDLGGIAQGFVAACVADTLRALGRRDFLIDVSGDIVCGGRRPGGAPWRIGIQNPRRPDSLLARLDLDVTAVTTSGAYEQFFEQDGKRYHHVFDPRTGWPATGATSVTVLSSDPIAADCYATAVFVMGPERGLAFLERRPDLRGVIVTEPSPGRLHLAWSDDLESRVRR